MSDALDDDFEIGSHLRDELNFKPDLLDSVQRIEQQGKDLQLNTDRMDETLVEVKQTLLEIDAGLRVGTTSLLREIKYALYAIVALLFWIAIK